MAKNTLQQIIKKLQIPTQQLKLNIQFHEKHMLAWQARIDRNDWLKDSKEQLRLATIMRDAYQYELDSRI